ncbi:MAG: pentapeptide repeat-containing protein [Woeseiaceae bacterium]|nr:pentapeptide repeat-containing protein [Woeseiaceae bacterium]
MPIERLSYKESCEKFRPDYLSDAPPLPDRMPCFDDEQAGLSFYRTCIGEGDDFSNLTIPRTFFGRSEIRDAAFRNTDLSQSRMCWNEFVDVDFTEADLSFADLRCSWFQQVQFSDANLTGADLRHSSFEGCDFQGADMTDAVLTRFQKRLVALTPGQTARVDWRWRSGEKPDGG